MKQTFELKSGKIVISDPCYDRATWCGIYGRKAMNGTWETDIGISDEGEWGKRVSVLVAKHGDFASRHDWEDYGTVGVDSGQMSIFDSNAYKDGEGEADKDGTFYNRCCRETCKAFDHRPKKKADEDYDWGVVDNAGVVSCSGYGDGSYPVEVIKEGDKIVAVRVTFIEEETDKAVDEPDYEYAN